ncbi:MAG: sigma-70 family RNA polymerase sigma factor [Oscillospiraceae bacterium]|nr:sigma-70 family RNA polymerase sigma factor [Oscillospiraceae bacterium]
MKTAITESHDELRARFTAWLETTIYRARLKYIHKEERNIPTVSLESLSDSCLYTYDEPSSYSSTVSQFDFEEERLANAFANLPIKRQQILTMLFVEERKPEEIARILHCSAQHVYDQRYQALRKLRKALTEEDT